MVKMTTRSQSFWNTQFLILLILSICSSYRRPRLRSLIIPTISVLAHYPGSLFLLIFHYLGLGLYRRFLTYDRHNNTAMVFQPHVRKRSKHKPVSYVMIDTMILKSPVLDQRPFGSRMCSILTPSSCCF